MPANSLLKNALKCLILACAVVAFADAAQAADDPEITSSMVYQNVGMLRQEIEQVRLVMGQRLPRERSFRVRNVEPRQTFYQAQSLFRKCNQLAQEVAGVSRQAPAPAPEGAISPADVNKMIHQAREQIGVVKQALDITEPVDTPPLERRRESADVLLDIVDAGYVVNEMIRDEVEWSQIYDRTLQMIAYIGGVLPDEQRYPELSPHECCKMPRDVQRELLAVMDALRPAAKATGFLLIEIEIRKAAEGGASADTVYDLTTTLVSDIAELTLRMNAGDVTAPAYPRPARIFPSHVSQLARVLREQASRL